MNVVFRTMLAFLMAAGMTSILPMCGGSTESAQAPDAGGAYGECTTNADCVIRPASCCGQCGAATRDDVVALNRAHASSYQLATCGDSFACPACYMAQDSTLVATCESGRCRVVDLLQHSSTRCNNASECRIRTNVCCECGGPVDVEHLIAVASESEFSALVCDGQACPECAPIYPPDVLAECRSGHCLAAWPL